MSRQDKGKALVAIGEQSRLLVLAMWSELEAEQATLPEDTEPTPPPTMWETLFEQTGSGFSYGDESDFSNPPEMPGLYVWEGHLVFEQGSAPCGDDGFLELRGVWRPAFADELQAFQTGDLWRL
jgi:hypothetical protein